jgi:hypothetical protein
VIQSKIKDDEMKKKELKTVFAILCLLLTVTYQVSAKENVIKSSWTDIPVKIDGFINEWKDDTLNVEDKVKVDYAFKNNADYIFVFFRFNDPKYLSTIEHTGITLWLNTQGKKKKNLGVKFTKKQISADEYIAMLEKRQGPLGAEQKEQFRQNASYTISQAKMVDKKGKPLDHDEQSASMGESANNVSVQEDSVVYEFRVDIKGMPEEVLGKAATPGEMLKIGFEWGGLTDEIRKEYMKGSASGGDSGPIGISEGGRGGGGTEGAGFGGASPAGLTALRKMTKEYSFWVDVHLAAEEMH